MNPNKDLVKSTLMGNVQGVRDAFNQGMASKVSDLITKEREEVADQYFNGIPEIEKNTSEEGGE